MRRRSEQGGAATGIPDAVDGKADHPDATRQHELKEHAVAGLELLHGQVVGAEAEHGHAERQKTDISRHRRVVTRRVRHRTHQLDHCLLRIAAFCFFLFLFVFFYLLSF